MSLAHPRYPFAGNTALLRRGSMFRRLSDLQNTPIGPNRRVGDNWTKIERRQIVGALAIAVVLSLDACLETKDPTEPGDPPNPDDPPADIRVIFP